MKSLNPKQSGFFDPIFGLALFAIFSLTGLAVSSAKSVEQQLQVACADTDQSVKQEDSRCK